MQVSPTGMLSPVPEWWWVWEGNPFPEDVDMQAAVFLSVTQVRGEKGKGVGTSCPSVTVSQGKTTGSPRIIKSKLAFQLL